MLIESVVQGLGKEKDDDSSLPLLYDVNSKAEVSQLLGTESLGGEVFTHKPRS